MTVATIPRPRTLDEVYLAIQTLDKRTQTLSEGVGENSTQIGRLAAEVAGLRHDMVSRSLPTIPPLPPMRDPDASIHDWDTDVSQLRAALREAVKDPHKPFNSSHARAIVQEGIQKAKQDEKAARWDSLIKLGKRVAVGVLVAYAIAVTLHELGLKP